MNREGGLMILMIFVVVLWALETGIAGQVKEIAGLASEAIKVQLRQASQ